MSIKHGVYFNEIGTAMQAAQTADAVPVAIGVAQSLQSIGVCYTLAEFESQFGLSGNADYTLEEAAKVCFQSYAVAPLVCINVLDLDKHVTPKDMTVEGITAFEIQGDIDINSVELTSGYIQDLVILKANEDFEVTVEEIDDIDEETEESQTKLHILNGDKIIDNKIKISYRTLSTALGGTPVETEVTLAGLIYEMPSDTVVESVAVTTGGHSTYSILDFEIEYESGVAQIEALDVDKIVDDKIFVTYNEIDPSKVEAADIVKGIEKVGDIYGKWGILPGVLIAPKFSLNTSVVSALTAKAKSIGGVFKAMAVADIEAASYTAAIELKKQSNLSDAHLILCYPQVKVDGEAQYLSTHVAALMCRVDADNENIPYVSPSNHVLQISSAVAGGKEIFLNREQANLLNENGIVTVFAFNGLRCWGNFTSMGASGDYKDKWIVTRRMVNFIGTYLIQTYMTNLDLPLNRRQVEGILQSANIWLASLVSRGILLGAELTFDEAENPVTELMNGAIKFNLRVLPPPPAQSITFTLAIDTSYFSNLFS